MTFTEFKNAVTVLFPDVSIPIAEYAEETDFEIHIPNKATTLELLTLRPGEKTVNEVINETIDFAVYDFKNKRWYTPEYSIPLEQFLITIPDRLPILVWIHTLGKMSQRILYDIVDLYIITFNI